MRRAQKRRNYRERKRAREKKAKEARLASIGSEPEPVAELVADIDNTSEPVELLKYARVWFNRITGRKSMVHEVDRINWRAIGLLDSVIAFQFFAATEGGEHAEEDAPMHYIGARQLSFNAAAMMCGRGLAISTWMSLNLNREREFAVRLEDGSWRIAFISDVHYDRDGKGGLRLRRPFGEQLTEPVKTAEAFASA
jgi:hypothetical protein